MAVYGFSRENSAAILRAVRREGLSSGREGGLGYPGVDRIRGVPFKNNSAETVPAWGGMRITGRVAKTSTSGGYLTIDKPNTSFQGLYLVNGPDDVVSGAYGGGTFLTDPELQDEDFAHVLYNTAATPGVGESWGFKNNSWLLHQHGPGFYIFGGTTGSGSTARVAAFQYDVTEVLGKADAAIAQGSTTATVRVYGGTPGSEADSGLTIANCHNKGRYIYDEEFVKVSFINGKPYVLPASGSTLLLGKSNGAISKSGSPSANNVSVWTDGFGADTTNDITATNQILSITASGKMVWVQWCNGTYYIVACECPV